MENSLVHAFVMRIEVFERVFLGRESVGHNVMRSLAGKPDHKPIVGIKCSDGIVVGADGAATLGNLSQMTARQPVRNLFVVSNVMIVGISGSIGLSQFLIDSIRGLWDAGGLKSKHPVQGMGILRDTMRPHAVREIQAAAAVRGAIGDHAALQSAVCSTVIAVTLARSDCLFQFDHQAAPEAATEELPFLAIGSGQNIADPFLAFLRSIFWPSVCRFFQRGFSPLS